jgi:hypothetical protein
MTETNMMHRVATKVQVGTAACAIAVAATLVPLPTAQAQPAAPLPQAIGSSAGTGSPAVSPDCEPEGSPDCLAAASLAILPDSILQNPIFQNPLWWFGAPNPNPPAQTTVFEFFPLALIPGFLRPLFGWFENINFEACILGLTLRIGPYGTVSGSYSRGCA